MSKEKMDYLERTLKPEGMDTILFWHLYVLMEKLEGKYYREVSHGERMHQRVPLHYSIRYGQG